MKLNSWEELGMLNGNYQRMGFLLIECVYLSQVYNGQ